MDIEQLETRTCLLVSIALAGWALFQVNQFQRDASLEQSRMKAKCVSAALHKLGAVGRWNEEDECCVVRMRFEVNLGPEPTFYEQDVPLDQLPPPSI